MARYLVLTLAGFLALAFCAPGAAQTPSPPAPRMRVDTAEAVAVLAILDAKRAGRPVSDAAWRRLFSSEGYVRLKARETGMGLPFTDSAFIAFVSADTLRRRASDLRRALSAWKKADIQGAALARAVAYLPADATIHATVYVVIKPRTNSFVWDLDSDPAIFLYLDPEVTEQKFANTVSHELHHVGFASVAAQTSAARAALPDSVRSAARWMGAFGEGFAMLAAAGGADVHPHAVSVAVARARWDKDVANFNQDLRKLEEFFLDVIGRRLATPDTVSAVASSFYGEQGPWYTVGWKMAVTIEKQFGRPELIRCMTDPRRLLHRYNAAATEYNRIHTDSLARWSEKLTAALGGDDR
jgi:hypothetical protein